MDFTNIDKIDHQFIQAHELKSADLLKYLFGELTEISLYYPDFYAWLTNTVMPGLISGERSIILEHRHGELAGVAILKDNVDEQKLCCLRVIPKFQGIGIGLKLFERSFNELDTDKPLLSIAEENTHKFKKILAYYGFQLEEEYSDLYRPNKTEFSFNGVLLVPKEKKMEY